MAGVLPWLVTDPDTWPASMVDDAPGQLGGSPTAAERAVLPAGVEDIVRGWRWSGATVKRRWFGEVHEPQWTDPPPDVRTWSTGFFVPVAPAGTQPTALGRLASGWPLRFLHGSVWTNSGVARATTGVGRAPTSIATVEWVRRIGPPAVIRHVPIGVRAGPLVINGALLGVGCWGTWFVARAMTRARRASRGQCGRCGYALSAPRLAAAGLQRRVSWRRVLRWTISIAVALAIGAVVSTGANAWTVLRHEPSAKASGRKLHYDDAPLIELPWVGPARFAALRTIAERGGPALDKVVAIETDYADASAEWRWLYVGRPGQRAAVVTIDVGKPWRSLRVHRAGVVERWSRWVDLKFAETPTPIWRFEVLWQGLLPSVLVWTVALVVPALALMWLFTFVRAVAWRGRVALGFGAASRLKCSECGVETVLREVGQYPGGSSKRRRSEGIRVT